MIENRASVLGGYITPVSGEEQTRKEPGTSSPPQETRRDPESIWPVSPDGYPVTTDEERQNRNNPRWWKEIIEEVESMGGGPVQHGWRQHEMRLRAAGADGITIEMLQDWYSRR